MLVDSVVFEPSRLADGQNNAILSSISATALIVILHSMDDSMG